MLNAPKIILVQEPIAAQPEAVEGKLFDDCTQISHDSLELVALTMHQERTFFAHRGAKSEPTCFSTDGVTPSDAVKIRQTDSCASCPRSMWFRGERPECRDSWSVLVILKETGVPRLLQIKSGSMAPFKRFLAQMEDARAAAEYRGEKHGLAIFDYSFTVGLTEAKRTGSRRFYWQAQFSKPTLLERIELADGSLGSRFAPLHKKYVAEPVVTKPVEEKITI